MEGSESIPKNQRTINRYSDKFKNILTQIVNNHDYSSQPPPLEQPPYKGTLQSPLTQPHPAPLASSAKDYYFYRVKSIGVGAHSFVYMVQEDNSRIILAQKSITNQHAKQERQNLYWEIKIQSLLQHENIIKLYHFYQNQTHVNLILEYAEQSLFALKQKYRIFKQKEVVQISRQILQALKYIHSLGLLHADIKLQNVMISNGTIKICDFGLAHKVGPLTKLENTTPVGTLQYLPQQYAGGLDSGQARDIWAVGVLAVEMVTGCHPFQGMNETAKWKALLENKPQWFYQWFKKKELQLQFEWPKVTEFVSRILCGHETRWSAERLLGLEVFKVGN